ncbi:MAG: TlpA family protein disulfide reductase [Bacteroidetes bacterium]|nr:TlpA family protein disulfide reductase [Bacteroidota bacterium]
MLTRVLPILALLLYFIQSAQPCSSQSDDGEFNRILREAAARIDSVNTIRLSIESHFTREGEAGPIASKYSMSAERADSLWTGCKVFGTTTDGDCVLFDGVRLLEGRPASGRMTSYAAARQPQHRIAVVLNGWDLAPIPMNNTLMRQILNDEHITERVISAGTLGPDSVLILACVSSIGEGMIETFTEWQLRTSDLMPLKVTQLYKMAEMQQWSNEIYIKAILVDPELEPGLFSGATLPKNIAITEAPKPTIDGPTLLKKGDAAPEFEADALQGGSVKLSDCRGKVVFLDFFYVDCFPCHRALPTLVELAKEFRDQGIVFLGIDSFDDLGSRKLHKLIDSMGIKYPVLLTNKVVDRLYGVGGYPTAIIIDREGKISYADSGFDKEFTPQEWREEILRAIER